ncbi:MAG TPA: hypothetical protein VGY66_32110 [Gemmataceae bacterium]|jgi:hypothetical protein|nr:hypothetical protein [Gemmataceae bacterium]
MGDPDPGKRHLPPELDTAARSNAIQLSGRQWLGVGLLAMAMIVMAPTLWKQVEKFDPEPDYRMPYELSNDYWLYDRYSRLAAQRANVLLLGDSVIWGQYVTRRETLSHCLNARAGRERFANLGLNGAHPVALAGLIEFYGSGIHDKNVLLFWNPLWLSSPRVDLRERKEFRFNHPRLAPQFVPGIPAYTEHFSPRVGIVVEQRVAFPSWAAHLQQAYYRDADGRPLDIPEWTLAHPYENPLRPLRQPLPPSDYALHEKALPWTARMKKQDYAWVDLTTSLQWHSFQRTVQILKRRGNRVSVLLGPFNEHLLSGQNAAEYHKLRSAVETWLQQESVPNLAPPPLPSAWYADADHALSAGYALLAEQVFQWLAR